MPSEDGIERAAVRPAPSTGRVYAAVLDAEMCPACAAHAGIEYPQNHPDAPTIPNAECTHPRGCRCTWL